MSSRRKTRHDLPGGTAASDEASATSTNGDIGFATEHLGTRVQLDEIMTQDSTDAGKSWFDYRNIQDELEFPKKPLNCLAPTSGQAILCGSTDASLLPELVFLKKGVWQPLLYPCANSARMSLIIIFLVSSSFNCLGRNSLIILISDSSLFNNSFLPAFL